MAKVNRARTKRRINRVKLSVKYQISEEVNFEYKNLSLIQKLLNDRGKILPRRITGVTAKQQRQLAQAVKRARFLALLSTGGIKK